VLPNGGNPKWEQVWHQAKITAAGLELMASLEADKIGASVAPGKNHYSTCVGLGLSECAT